MVQRRETGGRSDYEETKPGIRRQLLYREVNEQLVRLNDGWELFDDLLSLVCECGAPGCAEPITMPKPRYEAIRAVPARFLIKAGHRLDESDEVVEQHDGFMVVEKSGDDAEEAVRNDPRRNHRKARHD